MKSFTHLLYSLLLFLGLFCSANGLAQQRQLAFPGADGYGRFVTGGRGGEVCYVTRTDDCSDNDLVPGTLRWAIRHNNGGRPRTILFNVSGTIYLTSKLKFQYPNVSILGQSAPGGGICLTGYNMYICRNNVIIRYLRFRAGDIPNTSMTGLDLENARGVILDHCSMTWSMEECLTAYDTDSTTVQWCIIGEGLYNSKNSKGARAYATQWGGEHSTMHHTLITNSHSRAPRFNGVRAPSANKGEHDYQVDSEFANNVVFNWSGSGNQYGGEYDKAKVEVNFWCKSDPGYNRVYLINNYYRPGPATARNCNNNRYWCAPSTPYGQWYLSGNRFEVGGTYCPNTTVWSQTELDKLHADNYYGAESGSSSRGINLTGSNFTKYRLTELPYALSGLEYESAEQAYQQVVNRAGASLPRYDEVDQRLIDEAAGRVNPRFAGPSIPNEPGIIDSPDDIQLTEHDTYVADGVTYTNFPFLGLRDGDKYMVDSDADGLPDPYEDQVGLNKLDATDGNQLADNGYTHLENYLNGIADGTIDKAQYETSEEMVQPGQANHPDQVTYRFVAPTTEEGDCPDDGTVAWGTELTIPRNYSLYKSGHTFSCWSTDEQDYYPGDVVKLTADITFSAVFLPNTVSIDDRTADLNLVWDFTDSLAPVLAAGSDDEGIYVCQNEFMGSVIDVRLRYVDDQVTLPWCEGASVAIDGTTVQAKPAADFTQARITAQTPFSQLVLTLPFQTPSGDDDLGPYDAVVRDVDQLKEALAAAASRTDKETRFRIFLYDGTYDFGKVAKTAVPAMTSLIGQSQQGVVILNNPGPVSSNYQENTPVLFIDQNQNDVYMQDLTIRQDRDWAAQKSQGQAIALRQRGKRAVYKNVTLQGVQDTYYLNKADATAYFETSTLAGEVDFIYGDGTMWFSQCQLNPISSGACITASNAQTGYKGIIFDHCTISGASGYRLGRPWGDSPAVTYLYTTMCSLPNEAGWGSMTSGLKVRFHEYGSMDADGNLLDLSSRSIAACKAASGSDDPVLTAEQAEAYTLATTFRDWDPQARTQVLSAPELQPNAAGHTDLSWAPVQGAIGYILYVDGRPAHFLTRCNALGYDDLAGDITVRAVNQMGAPGLPSALLHIDGLTTVTAPEPAPAPLFNLMGQPVSSTREKGLYIRNGRKIMIK